MIYEGVLYFNNSPVIIPSTETVVTKNVKKKSKKIGAKLFNINTSDYKKLTSNKRVEIIQLFDKLDEKILKKFKEIHRNYLIKEVAYKTNVRLMTVVIKQNELIINFDKSAKEYDTKNLLKERAGYQNQNISYCMCISKQSELNYVIKLFENLYNSKTDNSKEIYIDNLLSDITTNILNIDKSIKKKKVNKGLMFKTSRNFAILERRKYGINVRILEVKDNDNLLSVVGRTNYEPLCRSFKIKTNEDINKYINLPVCSDSEIESSGQINEEQLKPFNAPLKISDMNVTSFFMEERIVYGNADVHKAWDFSASNNTPVYATCEGEVTQVSFKYSTNTIDKNGGGGNQIKIKCENDEETPYEVWYAHLYPNSAKVKVGDKVKGWQQIAEVGTTGYSTGPHLHYQVSLNGSYIDGMSLIDFTSEDSSSYKPPLEKPSFGNNNGLDNFLDR